MGVSTDGILFFGFDLGEDEENEWPWEEEDEDWENAYLKRKGFETVPFTADGSPGRSKYESYYEKRKELLKECACTIGHHCSDSYGMRYVALKDHNMYAWRGEPKEVPPQFLMVSNEEVSKLKEFCEFMGIEWRTPKWYLASYWG